MLLISAALCAAGPPGTAQPPWKTVFETAEFVLSDSSSPPAEAAGWATVPLPDDWRRIGADFRGRGWYLIKFDLREAPARPLAVYVRHMRSGRMDLFVNRALLGGSADLHGPAPQATGFQIFLTIPPSLLISGNNVLHVRMDARSSTNPAGGLGRVTLGDANAVREISFGDANLTSGAYRLFFAAMLTAGVIALFLWYARRGDRVMLGFSLMCLSWAAASAVNYYLRREGIPQDVMRMLQQYVNMGLPVPVVILGLRTVGLRWPRIEALLWMHLAFVVTFPLWWSSPYAVWAWSYLRIANPLLPLAGAVVVFMAAPRPLRWPHEIETLALLAMALTFSMDIARDIGWLELDVHNFRPYHVPVLLLAFGAAIFERHVAAIWRTERANLELEQRVAEKVQEIEDNHRQVRVAMRERALAAERQRILADMHDGLGSSLISLLRHVQSGQSDHASIEQRVQVALQEMRIAIDALQPNEGDLAAVLGSLRYRLDSMIRATGVRLLWQVEELPALRELKPSTIFSLQRILLEAITNTLKHSGARELRFSAHVSGETTIEICIADDGCGFDLSRPTSGLGLTNIRNRAARIGARLDIRSEPGKGTSVRLSIPGVIASATSENVPAPERHKSLELDSIAAGSAP